MLHDIYTSQRMSYLRSFLKTLFLCLFLELPVRRDVHQLSYIILCCDGSCERRRRLDDYLCASLRLCSFLLWKPVTYSLRETQASHERALLWMLVTIEVTSLQSSHLCSCGSKVISKLLFLSFLLARCAGFRLSDGCDWSSKARAFSAACATPQARFCDILLLCRFHAT